MTRDRCSLCGQLLFVPWWGGRKHTFLGTSRYWRKCRSCKTIELHPMPSAATLAEIYSEEYLKVNVSETMPTKQKNEDLIQFVASTSPSSIADFGCGSGQQVVLLNENGWSTIGFEYSNSMVTHVNSTLGSRIRHISEVDRHQGEFDVVLLNDVLEHTPTPGQVLLSCSNLLSHEGALRIDTPLEGEANLFSIALRLNERIRRGSPVAARPYHLHLFTLHALMSLLNQDGWRLTSVEPYNVMWPAPESYQRALQGGARGIAMFVLQKVSVMLSRFGLGGPNRAVLVASRL